MQQSNIIISGIRKKRPDSYWNWYYLFCIAGVCVVRIPFSLYVFTACWANLIFQRHAAVTWAMSIYQKEIGRKKSFDQGRRRHRLLLYFTIFIIQRSVNKYFPIFILPLVRKIRSTFARVAWPDRGTIGGIIKWLKTTYTGLQKRPLLKVFKLAVTGGLWCTWGPKTPQAQRLPHEVRPL